MEEGMPDLMIPIPMSGHHGLFIEMKTKTGKTATRQKALLQWLSDRNYKCVVARSTEEAIAYTKAYLSS